MVEQDGTVKGYVETLNFTGGATVTVTGPVASVAAGGGGGGGGDADTLQGHPASYFATEADLTTAEANIATLLDRATNWALLGVTIQNTPPAGGITYAAWLAGGAGYWAWIEIP